MNEFKKYGTDSALDNLVNNKNWHVRIAVAEQGYGLDVLIKDEDWEVRRVVAKQGYGLDKLIRDEDEDVRAEADYYLRKHHLTLDEWKIKNQEDIEKNRNYGTDSRLDALVDNKFRLVRLAVAEQGYGLDKLIKDVDTDVRCAVARQGFGLDRLVADEDWEVRIAVAEQGFGLDKLVDDEYWAVRAAVAGQGYGLDVLISDNRLDVQEMVDIYLQEQQLTLDEWKKQYPDRLAGVVPSSDQTNDLDREEEMER